METTRETTKETTASLPMPLPESVQRMLADLLGKPVTAKKAAPGGLSTAKPGVVAHYVYDSGVTGSLILCDLALSSYAGAALMLLPPAAAVEGVKAGKMNETIVENIREVLNICASLFIYEDKAHVRLRELYPLPGTTTPEVAKILTRPSARLELDVTITGYGAGKIALLTA
jgi:hypothetical protein